MDLRLDNFGMVSQYICAPICLEVITCVSSVLANWWMGSAIRFLVFI